MSWDAYFPRVVCHYEGEIVAVGVDKSDRSFLIVQVRDSMDHARLKRVGVEEVKVLPLPEYSRQTNLIVNRLGGMGVIVTGEMCDAIEEIVRKHG